MSAGDAHGNMTSRIEGGVTYNHSWDVQNRLTQVTRSDSPTTTTFDYDAAGSFFIRKPGHEAKSH